MTGAPFRIKRHPREALVVHINSNYQLPHPICAHNMKCHQTMRFLGRALRTKETWSADVESYSTHPRSFDCLSLSEGGAQNSQERKKNWKTSFRERKRWLSSDSRKLNMIEDRIADLISQASKTALFNIYHACTVTYHLFPSRTNNTIEPDLIRVLPVEMTVAAAQHRREVLQVRWSDEHRGVAAMGRCFQSRGLI